MRERKTPQRKSPPAPHYNPRSTDYGLAPTRLRHNPSSGFSYSDAELFRDERALNPNVRYVPGENNRDELREWDERADRVRRSAHSHRKSSGISDDAIFEIVHEVLSKHPEIDVSQLEIDVRDAVVMIGGVVETRRMKRLIEDVIYGLPGIHDVKNHIDVERRDPDRRRIAHSLS